MFTEHICIIAVTALYSLNYSLHCTWFQVFTQYNNIFQREMDGKSPRISLNATLDVLFLESSEIQDLKVILYWVKVYT